MNILNLVIALAIGYLLGSIPFALVIGKVFYKTDVREHGSGNLGGTNTGRVLGRKAGLAVSVLDTLKACLAMLIVSIIDPSSAIYAGLAATIGHCFPIFANFKGGKAVSTAMGYLLGTALLLKSPLIFVIPLATWLLVLKISKYVSLASMVAISVAVITSLFLNLQISVTILITILDILIIYRHRANIQRIKDKTESKVTWI